MKKKTLLLLTLLSGAIYAQVPIKGSTVDATQGYTVNGAAPSNQVLCGNGTHAVMASSCGISVANSSQVGGVALSGLCQTSGTGCPASSIIALTCNSNGCYEKSETGVISEYIIGAYSSTLYDSTPISIPFPLSCPTSVITFSVTTSTTGTDYSAAEQFTVSSYSTSSISVFNVHNADHGNNPIAPAIIIKCH